MEIYKKWYYVSVLFIFFLCTSNFALGGIHYVGTTGNNAKGDGTIEKPWRTISYALSKAISGDVISINEGTYNEVQLKIPVGVSLTSSSQNFNKVKIQPSVSLNRNNPFLVLNSDTPGSEGNQTISYVEFSGKNGSIRAEAFASIKNRSNVRITNCNIHDFFTDGTQTHYGIVVESTQIRRTSRWWCFYPVNLQEPGNDRNLDYGVDGFPISNDCSNSAYPAGTKYKWPKNPVKNFSLDNNCLTNVNPLYGFNLKDSRIHHNRWNNKNAHVWCIKATAAFFWNVDIYNNTFYGKERYDPEPRQTTWRVETWLHRGGCEIYRNKSDGPFSITRGKETKVYDNEIIFEPYAAYWDDGIEFAGQSHGEVYSNYIEGAGVGITVGVKTRIEEISEGTTVRDNIIINHKYDGIRVKAEDHGGGKPFTKNYRIHGNIIDGQTSSERKDNYCRGRYGIAVRQSGNGKLENISVENNIVIDNQGKESSCDIGYGGATIGEQPESLIIVNNNFYNNRYNRWNGGNDTYTNISKPVFPSQYVEKVNEALNIRRPKNFRFKPLVSN